MRLGEEHALAAGGVTLMSCAEVASAANVKEALEYATRRARDFAAAAAARCSKERNLDAEERGGRIAMS